MSLSIYFIQAGADQECQSCKTTIKTGVENRRTQVCSLLLEMVVAPGSCREGDRPVSGGGSKGLSRHMEESMRGDKRKAEKKNETTLSSSKTDSTFISFSEHPYFLLFHPKLCLAAPSLPFLFPILLNLSLLPLKK